MKWFRDITGIPNRVRHYRDIREPIGKIVFGDLNTESITRLAQLLAAHPMANEFDFIRSELTLYEILPKGISKGVVIPKLAELLGLDPKRTIAVGDYNNDVEMIRAAGVGFAVANAVPEVKAVADRITVSNQEHAIAKIISEIDSGELKI